MCVCVCDTREIQAVLTVTGGALHSTSQDMVLKGRNSNQVSLKLKGRTSKLCWCTQQEWLPHAVLHMGNRIYTDTHTHTSVHTQRDHHHYTQGHRQQTSSLAEENNHRSQQTQKLCHMCRPPDVYTMDITGRCSPALQDQSTPPPDTSSPNAPVREGSTTRIRVEKHLLELVHSSAVIIPSKPSIQQGANRD